MKRRFRLRRRRDFDRVMGAQRVFAGRVIVAFARPSSQAQWRVGVTVSRRLKGAVARNRLRRRLREAARATLLPGEAPAFDVVLIGRPAAVEAPLSALEEETTRVRARIAASAASPPPPDEGRAGGRRS